MTSRDVAIVGAGPAGIAAARYLKGEGFSPVLFESHSDIGGQWDWTNAKSGVWPEMRTNTVRATMNFSDLDFPSNLPPFPRNTDVHQYLKSYVERFGLADNIKFGTELLGLARSADGFELCLRASGNERVVSYPRVVVATGRYNEPMIPSISGMESFEGELGVEHAFRYKDPCLYREKRVLVAGGSISALEILSDLALLGAKSAHLAQRRQRYVLPKMVRGVPIEYFAFTLGGARQRDTVAREELLRAQQGFVLAYGGDPARYGAPSPHPDIEQAGFTGSQYYLNLLAEDRIKVHPWIERVEGHTVFFEDGQNADFDAIIFGTGFNLSLPFLSDDIAAIIGRDADKLKLANFTFHPDLPGLAFMGMWAQQGPYNVPLEQQARYVAYSWSGKIPAETRETLTSAIERSIRDDHYRGYRDQNEMALRFARLAGAEPIDVGDAELADLLNRSATTSIMFRINGPDALPDAADTFRRQFERFGPRGDQA